MADFPYRYNFMPSFKEMFDRLKKIDLNNVSKITAGNALGLIERSFPDDYENTDSLADHFVESERILANERGQKSPLETWLAMPKSTENIRLLREKVYQKSRGCNLFNPVLARYLFTRFGGERILDCCAGWGDRLIAALACPKIKEYRAWDPNAELQKCYNAMAEATAHKTLQWSIIPQPFEEAVLEKRYFDLSFASPPFYDKEVYRGSKNFDRKISHQKRVD